MNAPKGSDIDHVNHDPLDNRRSNLRICTRSQNNMNKVGVRGVSKFKDGWRARIKRDYVEKHLGIFKTFEEALRVRQYHEKIIFNQFSNI